LQVKSSRRTAGRLCPIDYALQVFGDRWTLLVLRDLMLGGRRHYQDLALAKEGIATNILAARLKKLEASGLVVRRPDPRDRRRIFYALTDKALDLIPVMLEISRWSAKYDRRTAAPANLVRRINQDRERLIRDLVAAARARQAENPPGEALAR
jgi:DNA-binding HxlR family transcriptional regulator